MCEECLLENNDVDNLLEQYKQQPARTVQAAAARGLHQ